MACPPPEFDWSSWATWSCLREDIAPIATFVGAAIIAWAALAQARTARRRHEEQTKADLERRITESFAKAVEQLGSEKLETRLGAIYTLERLSRESEREYWPIMEVLTAYVREHAPSLPRQADFHPFVHHLDGGMAEVANKSSSSDGLVDQQKKPEISRERIQPKTDVQAILTVLGRRKQVSARLARRLAKRILSRIHIPVRFILIIIVYRKGLARPIRRLAERILLRINTPEEDDQRLDLSGTDLRGATLSKANLEGAKFTEANLKGADFTGANLKGAYLMQANLERAHLREANLEDAQFWRANLKGAYLARANLKGAYLTSTNLEGAEFTEVNLKGARLRWADLKGAFLLEANLRGAHFGWADLKGARELTQEQINSALGDENTILPEGLDRPAHWTES